MYLGGGIPGRILPQLQQGPFMKFFRDKGRFSEMTVSYTHLRAHETVLDLVCRLLLEKKKTVIPHLTLASAPTTSQPIHVQLYI